MAEIYTILNTELHNIKYIGLIGSYDNKVDTTLDLDAFLIPKCFGKDNTGGTIHPVSWRCKSISLYSAYGIFLGSSKDILNNINSKLDHTNINLFKKVYFDPQCTYPRYKLSVLSTIKRTTKISNADTAIISKGCGSFVDHNCDSYVCKNKSTDYLILYSSSENCYYFIDWSLDTLSNQIMNVYLQELLCKYADNNLTGYHRFASALINKNILPADCNEIYCGKTVILDYKGNRFLQDLFTRYTKLTYDTDLDNFLTSGLEPLSEESISSIEKMIASRDSSTIEIGINLLCNIPVTKYPCTITMLLIRYVEPIFNSNLSKSVKFKYILDYLEISRKTIYIYSWNLLDTMYAKSTDEDDKKIARQLIQDKISFKISQLIELNKRQYPNMGFDYTLIIK